MYACAHTLMHASILAHTQMYMCTFIEYMYTYICIPCNMYLCIRTHTHARICTCTRSVLHVKIKRDNRWGGGKKRLAISKSKCWGSTLDLEIEKARETQRERGRGRQRERGKERETERARERERDRERERKQEREREIEREKEREQGREREREWVSEYVSM